MRTQALHVVSALSVALALSWSAGAQPPDQNPPPFRGPDDRSDPRDGFRAGPGRRAGRGGEFGVGGGLERAVEELKLADNKKEQALAAVRTYQENVRKLMGLARSELLLKMKEVLSEQEFKQFKDALDRPAALADVRGRRGGGFAGNRGLSTEQIVERIMSFDKNGDGKITKDELPERMQDLIARGDTNKDGALDAEEVKQLANDLANRGRFRQRADRGGPGARFRPGPFGGFPAEVGIARALNDLNLSGKKKETAESAVKAHQENIRKLMDLARADLLLKMTAILSDEDLKSFKTALDRAPGFAAGFNGRNGPFPGPAGPAGASRSGDLERRLDQLQKNLDELRREIRR